MVEIMMGSGALSTCTVFLLYFVRERGGIYR